MTDSLVNLIRNEGFHRVRIRATVTLDAYVLDPEAHGGATLAERVRDEIDDAVRYRGPHLTDTEEGDALITVTERRDPIVTLDEVTIVDADDATPEYVADLARGFAAEVF